MKITEKDLVGDIKDFPIEVVQRMVDEQVSQGNPADVSVFQQFVLADDDKGGFFWVKTTDGEDFWHKVIANKNFDLFFDKYPKEHEDDFWIDPKGRRMLVWDGDERLAKERLVIAKLPSNCCHPYIVIDKIQENIFLEGHQWYSTSRYKNAKPIPEKEEAVELTLEQIAEKFSISVDKLKIKK